MGPSTVFHLLVRLGDSELLYLWKLKSEHRYFPDFKHLLTHSPSLTKVFFLGRQNNSSSFVLLLSSGVYKPWCFLISIHSACVHEESHPISRSFYSFTLVSSVFTTNLESSANWDVLYWLTCIIRVWLNKSSIFDFHELSKMSFNTFLRILLKCRKLLASFAT